MDSITSGLLCIREKPSRMETAYVISGQPGTWQFSFTKEGYDPLNLNYNVTETGEGAVYLQRTVQS